MRPREPPEGAEGAALRHPLEHATITRRGVASRAQPLRRPRLARVGIVVTFALPALMTAGCGAEPGTSPTATSPAGSAPTALSSAATPTGGTPTPNVTATTRLTTTAPAGRPAPEAVKAATLTAADLPGNDWVAESGESLYRLESKSSNPRCETHTVLTAGPLPAATATYAFSVVLAPGVEYVDGVALAYRDEAAAAAAVTPSCR